MKNFIWGGNKSLHWIAWDKLCQSYEDGGIQIHPSASIYNLYWRNNALTSLLMNSLWASLVKAKYSKNHSWIQPKGSSWIYKSIFQLMPIISSNRRTIGNGNQTSFWFDTWVLEAPPALYPIEVDINQIDNK